MHHLTVAKWLLQRTLKVEPRRPHSKKEWKYGSRIPIKIYQYAITPRTENKTTKLEFDTEEPILVLDS